MFDEQSFKAYINITSNNGWIPLKIESDWQSYKEYQEFYIKKAEELGVENEYWRLYKALWAFGNRLSSGKLQELKKEPPFATGISKTFHGNDYPLMLSNTLGPKAKSFKWRITPSQDLVISRVFKGDNLKKTTLAKNEVDRIERFVRIKGDWVDLANNVEKLGNGTEKEGIGSFIYKQLGRNTVEAQLSSHIGAIFVNAGIWEYRKQRGLQFKSKGESWQIKLPKK
ncbi:hypothetical protein [Marinilabilia salmonicolor]|uniref:Uncharacterized protein n=1 Tax=Marinilabilia salmonicolor TaxID=989 RepID=A0A368UMH1_9BACT|nr:hypothetical protein [Marinilabilia salmonicolor]RCW24158.1 hypothetical protein DFO77_1463 [Marinilabilia salmonicolor]